VRGLLKPTWSSQKVGGGGSACSAAAEGEQTADTPERSTVAWRRLSKGFAGGRTARSAIGSLKAESG